MSETPWAVLEMMVIFSNKSLKPEHISDGLEGETLHRHWVPSKELRITIADEYVLQYIYIYIYEETLGCHFYSGSPNPVGIPEWVSAEG